MNILLATIAKLKHTGTVSCFCYLVHSWDHAGRGYQGTGRPSLPIFRPAALVLVAVPDPIARPAGSWDHPGLGFGPSQADSRFLPDRSSTGQQMAKMASKGRGSGGQKTVQMAR